MKKTKKRIIVGTAVTSAFLLGGCFQPQKEVKYPEPYDPQQEKVEEVYGPPVDLEPEENREPAVYGPPEDES